MRDDHGPPDDPVPLHCVAAALAPLVAAEAVLAAAWPPGPDGAPPGPLVALLDEASHLGRGASPAPGRPRVVAGLGHEGFSLLASHLVDVLDDLDVDVDAGADLLAGLARLRGTVVDPTVEAGGTGTTEADEASTAPQVA